MGILAAGAGAAEGLDTFLERMLKEAQMAEAVRSNKAREKQAADSLAETSGLRRETMEQNNILRTTAAEEAKRRADMEEKNRTRDDMRAALDDLVPGVTVTPDTRDKAVTSGAAVPERFKENRTPFVGPMPEGEDRPGDLLENFTLLGQNKQPTQTSYQRDTYLVNGKPEDLFIDPRQPGSLFHMDGSPVQQGTKVEHYEKPPQPQKDDPYYSPIVIGDKRERFNHRTGQYQDASGNPLRDTPTATTASTLSMQEGSKMLAPHVPELRNMAVELDKRGLFGPVMGRIRDLATRFGTMGSPEEIQNSAEQLASAIMSDPQLNNDELAGQFATALGLMTSGMGRVHGGARGGGSIQMINYLKTLLSGTSSLSMFNGRLNTIDSYLKGYAAGPNAGSHAPGTDGPPPAAAPSGGFRVVGSRPVGGSGAP